MDIDFIFNVKLGMGIEYNTFRDLEYESIRYQLKNFLVFLLVLLVLALCWFLTEEIPITVSRLALSKEAWPSSRFGLMVCVLALILVMVLVMVFLGAVLLPDTVKKIGALLSTY